VRTAERLLATLPVSDTEMLERMRQRCAVLETRAAGATKLVEAAPRVPSPRRPA
jgi:phage shock protein A